MKIKEYFSRERLKCEFHKGNYLILLEVFVLSVFINLIVEIFSRRSASETFAFLLNSPFVFLYGCVLIFFTLSIALLFRRRGFWIFLISTFWIGISFANFVSLGFRSMPMTASDIWLTATTKDIFEVYLSHAALGLVMVGITVLLALLFLLWYITKKRKAITVFAISNLLVLGVFLYLLSSLFYGTGVLDRTNTFSSLPRAYDKNGFAYCFGASLVTGGIDRPHKYTSERVEQITGLADRQLPETSEHTPNIVFVQLESFFDPNYLQAMSFPENPIPVFTELKANYPSGLLSVPGIGAGTANTEFEVLTGMNLTHFGVGEYPYMTIVDSNATESLCYALNNIGYTSHALHNNNATFYDRHIVYKNLCFNSFTSIEYMNDLEYNPLGWADDSVLTGEIVKALNSTPAKDFVFAVSVQPHGKYPQEPLENAGTLPVEGAETEARKNGLEYYLYQLKACDEFVGELISALSAFDEPTVAVFYGDHLPSFNITNEELSYGDNQTTEYVIWSNFELQGENRDLQTYQLGAYVMELCGIYEGTIFRLHQSYGYAADNDEAYQDTLQVLEYDMLDGKQYYTDGKKAPVPTQMRFDVEDVEIAGIEIAGEEKSFYIHGKNFTANSMIYVNNTAYETFFVSKECLLVENVTIEQGDLVYAAQVSSAADMQILSVSEPFSVE